LIFTRFPAGTTSGSPWQEISSPKEVVMRNYATSRVSWIAVAVIVAALGGAFAASPRAAQAAPPTFTKRFGAASILVGGTTSVTFTITNTNVCPPGDALGTCDVPAIALTNLTFTDTLPGGLVVSPSLIVNSCGGTVTATPGSGTISLSGGLILGSSIPFITTQCIITVTVTGVTPGVKLNSAGF
jgi:hypothetical protein